MNSDNNDLELGGQVGDWRATISMSNDCKTGE